jgi:endonuclease/exonuclease/phosphatase family metal-dependent hydrolase
VRLRVLVYNVRGFRAGADRVAAAVADRGPDLALVQECGSGRRLRTFARAMGMEAFSIPLFPFLRQVRNAVLVRHPWRIISSRLHPFDRSARFYPRGALVAVVGRAGYRISAFSVHLGLTPGERNRHARELADLALAIDHPVLIGGDFNEGPNGKAVSWIADRFWDAWPPAGSAASGTFPSADPTARIDDLFVSEHFAVNRAMVLDTVETRAASDHLPLLADLELE